jgi:hypothetical protein
MRRGLEEGQLPVEIGEGPSVSFREGKLRFWRDRDLDLREGYTIVVVREACRMAESECNAMSRWVRNALWESEGRMSSYGRS